MIDKNTEILMEIGKLIIFGQPETYIAATFLCNPWLEKRRRNKRGQCTVMIKPAAGIDQCLAPTAVHSLQSVS